MKETFTYNRKQIAALFLVLFGMFVFTPTVIVLVDSNVDVSMFYSVVEEEEESAENNKTEKSEFIKRMENWKVIIAVFQEKGNLDYHREKDYAFVMADQFCPPPELS
ncbi:hypothetical protein [Echinicola sp. 20G]|uniref:hypothetical protein n=1 Tax=Echinicola sp. 20G TaxID=2781961 RepID=UPI001F3E9368|nr:hypothetical protein [Echinicola sp. 20G]